MIALSDKCTHTHTFTQSAVLTVTLHRFKDSPRNMIKDAVFFHTDSSEITMNPVYFLNGVPVAQW